MDEQQMIKLAHAFPSDFRFGVASAAYQIEGAAHEDGRGASIWDTFSRTPGKVINGETGDIACDHYHRYPQDFALMKKLGFDHYRLSFAWPRFFPDGKGPLNQRGVDFYDRLIDELLRQGIDPFVTLYHWDLPQALEDQGGWKNRDTAYRFEEYAGEVFRRFGDRVKSVITHNEPWCASVLGYLLGVHAPGIQDMTTALEASHHILLSHGLAIREYRKQGHSGQIGITLNLNPVYAATSDALDQAAANRQDVFSNRWFLDPVLKGQYPHEMAEWLGALPSAMRPDDLSIIAEKSDFLGINFYSYAVVAHDPTDKLLQLRNVTPQDHVTDMGWPIKAPTLRDLMNRIKREYGDIPLYVTENGAAYPDVLEGGHVHDADRTAYVAQHIQACADAIGDGVDLRGYFLWTFMDNFEWAFGYSKRFGIVYTDYETQERTPKDSALWYSRLLQSFRSHTPVSK